MKREITKEEFEKVINTLFPWGYTGNLEKWDSDYFLGWAYINEDSHLRDVMCVNYDCGGVVFWLIRCDDVNEDMVTGAIDGMMHALLPGMIGDSTFGKEGRRVVMYEFK